MIRLVLGLLIGIVALFTQFSIIMVCVGAFRTATLSRKWVVLSGIGLSILTLSSIIVVAIKGL